jgi:hypothetical protein
MYFIYAAYNPHDMHMIGGSILSSYYVRFINHSAGLKGGWVA